MKRILLASIILTSMAALLASCSCGSNSKETSEAELNDSTKTAIEMENKSRKKSRKKTVLVPPKKNKNNHLSRDEVRSINKKKMSRRRKLKKHILTILLAGVVMCVGLVLVFSLFFKANTITISGDKVYSDKMVVDKSGVEIGDNLFRINEEKLSQKLSKELPYIKSVTIERKLPDTIIFNIEAAKEIFQVKNMTVAIKGNKKKSM